MARDYNKENLMVAGTGVFTLLEKKCCQIVRNST
jgi:hypothetical protein